MTVEGATRDEAVTKLKGIMDEKGIAAHMAAKHPNEPMISVADCHAMIDKELQPS